ncbi:hypothetical protein KR009_005079 [Drosophila setifemur]|nr:hypothetical protein KR009_005079 [Drosophila setifemur]
MLGKDNGAVTVQGLRLLLIGSLSMVAMVTIVSAYQLPPGSHKLCGAALSDAMDAVCIHGYNSFHQKRRDVGWAPDSEDGAEAGDAAEAAETSELSDTGYALSPLLSSLFGAEVLIKTRRRQRRYLLGGIYDKCCVNSCSYDELALYCRRPAGQ